MSPAWKAYHELAWVEDWLADPAGEEREAGLHVRLLRQAAPEPPRTLLHLGSGAGRFDRVFKRHFTVTGADVSPGMLDMARARNPDVEYAPGDMRTLRLKRTFDAVAIPDSIDYMASPEDLEAAIRTAAAHLRPGGVLLVAAKPEETFRDNNFVYTGEKDGIRVTLFENNCRNPHRPHTYEATLVYLVRNRGEQEIHTECHRLGLFPRAVWDRIFRRIGFSMRETVAGDLYDRFVFDEGAYPVTVFTGRFSPPPAGRNP